MENKKQQTKEKIVQIVYSKKAIFPTALTNLGRILRVDYDCNSQAYWADITPNLELIK
jgi:hypothetical protein